MLNIVVLNGGRGAASIIPALLRRDGLNVTSIVNAYDDGKSTGEIRRFFDMLGPSDIRKVQELMLPEGDDLPSSKALFEYRYPVGTSRDDVLADMRQFSDGGATIAGIAIPSPSILAAIRRFVGEFLHGLTVIEKVMGRQFSFDDCALMNCLYAGAYLALGRDIERTTRTFDRLFRLKGTVIPNSMENKWLTAMRRNGELLSCEAEIVELRSNVLIDALYLLDRPLDRAPLEQLDSDEQRYYLQRHHAAAAASPGVRLALEQADIIIYSAGTQHSSLYPTYMSQGVAEMISGNRGALKVFVTNIGADYETPTYCASDYLEGALRYLRMGDGRVYDPADLFSTVLVNDGRRKADETYVHHDSERDGDIAIPRIVADFESAQAPGKHDGDKVVSCILKLYGETMEG
ncbi:hypothetical protein ASE86_14290 [Sphingomonas sp. Leaf33]|uniref:2-phospho-L-lactate transferase CofD family protein n=1 Tax=Sphingomonas sp. Leaf33 TaxID=1736215 RepID=UPI0006FEA4F5|nr:2-phospho-L-lactate transferase CofD family protein [Sphingomonas sp. Leaf33]KQN22943.1 hypothetical protein ASE86_14290 [Sphingomonas sp. Leaf33]